MGRYRALLLASALLAARPAVAGIELAGTTGANFLSVNPGASLVGMGGTGVGGYPDLSAMTWNPASLGLMQESQLMLTHMPLPNSATQEWMSFGGRMGIAPTRWALSGRYEGDGSFQAHDALGNLTGTFNSSSLALGVNAARPLDKHTVVGMGAKFVNENLGAVSGYGGTFDMGILYHAGPLSLGAAGQNMGGSMKYDSLAYSMPLNFGTGLALASVKTGLRVAVDYNHPNAYYDDVRTGAEWMWKDRFALRVGYRKELNAPTNDPLNGTSAGLGFGGKLLWLDYGFISSGDGSTQQRITLRVSPKDWGFNFGADLDNPNGTSGATAQPAPPAKQPAASSSTASTPSSTPTSTSTTPAASSAPVASAPAPAASAPAPAAVAPVVAPSTPPATSSSAAAASIAPTSAPSVAPAPISPKPAAPAPTIAKPAPVAVMPPPVAPPPSAPMPTASSSTPPVPEPAPPSPELTTLVPVTPPAIPAPKPVVASRPTSMPGVSAPAPQIAPSEAPVTTPAPDGAATPAKGKKGKPVEASAAVPAVAATPAVESAVGKDGKPVRIHAKKDETLDSIAKRFGTTKAALMMENNLVTEKIHPGQELKIPNHQ